MVRLFVPLLFVAAFADKAAGQAPQFRSFNPQQFHAAPGPNEFVDVESAVPLHHKGWAIGLFFNYARNPISLLATEQATQQQIRTDLMAHAISADLWAAVGVLNRLQIALALPMTIYQSGDAFNSVNPTPDGTHVPGANGFALGDPRVYLKVRLYGKSAGFQVAISHWLSIPVGNDTNFGGEKNYTGFAGEPRVLAGYEGRRVHAGLFVGFHWRANSTVFLSTVAGQQLTYGGAVAYDVIPQRLTLIGELFGHSNSFDSVSPTKGVNFTDANDSPLELDVAARVMLVRGLGLTGGLGYGVVPGVGAPQPRVFLGMVYAPDNRDRDRDGIPDTIDKCPDQPEDKDGFQDDDGCPEPDNDGDGIPDGQDKCPNEAEDFDGFQDQDGCPDPDNDGDGIPDVKDACPNDREDGLGAKPNDGCPLDKTDTDEDGVPDSRDKCINEPEDKDGFEDDDGCPDPDNDKDGLLDGVDKCPNQPETKNGYLDEDGCPDEDPDSDGDGIIDLRDKCPLAPETINGVFDEDGCPDKGPPTKVREVGDEIILLERVEFAKKKPALEPRSFNLLDQVASTLKIGTWIKRVVIEGHTDTKGNPGKNLRLSQEEAELVRGYLIGKGVDGARLVARGMGGTRPVVTGKTPRAREANKRIEIHVLEQGPRPFRPAPSAAPAPSTDPAPAAGQPAPAAEQPAAPVEPAEEEAPAAVSPTMEFSPDAGAPAGRHGKHGKHGKPAHAPKKAKRHHR